MNIADKLTTIAENLATIGENEQKVFDAGVDNGILNERTRFWDDYQYKGNLANYNYSFSGQGWNNKTFNPQYHIKPTSANGMFNNSAISGDLVELLDKLKITLDFGNCTTMNNIFSGCLFTRIGVVDHRNTTSASVTFGGARSLKQIDNFILRDDGTNTFSSTFTNAVVLEHLTITGTIGQNGFNVQHSVVLSKASIVSIINALSDTTSGLTVTLSKTAVNNAFGINVDDATTWGEGTEYYTLRHSKDNWSISYI